MVPKSRVPEKGFGSAPYFPKQFHSCIMPQQPSLITYYHGPHSFPSE